MSAENSSLQISAVFRVRCGGFFHLVSYTFRAGQVHAHEQSQKLSMLP